jgi:hypothetical protein
MALNTENIPVFGPLGPLGPKDEYPTHYANFGMGGMMQVASVEERDAIPLERRQLGLHVAIINWTSNSSEDSEVYVLSGGITNEYWALVAESVYSTSYGPQIMFNDEEPGKRKGGGRLGDGDLWVNNTNYALSVYSLEQEKWILLSGVGSGSGSAPPGTGNFPGVNPRYPEDTLPVLSDPWDNGTTNLTASGCIEMSLDNTTYTQGPLTINNDDELWLRWSPDLSCAGAAHGTTLQGRITNGIYVADGRLLLNKVPDLFQFSNVVDQFVSSVTSSNTVTLTGLNANTKIWAPSGTSTAREVSINGGSWTSLPSSYGSALVAPFQLGGPTIRVRHTNSPQVSTAVNLQIKVGNADTEDGSVSTLWSTTTTSSGPSIAQPSILTPTNNSVGIDRPTTVTSSTYQSVNGAGLHAHSDWQVNSGPLIATSTNQVTSISHINTDLGPNKWQKVWGLPISGLRSNDFYNYERLGISHETTYQEGRRSSLVNPTDSFTTIYNYAYSFKYDRYVAALGTDRTIGRIAYLNGASPNTWVDANIDQDLFERKGFKRVIWFQKAQMFIALRARYVDNSNVSLLGYTSADGISWVLSFDLVTNRGSNTTLVTDASMQDLGNHIVILTGHRFYVSTDGFNYTQHIVGGRLWNPAPPFPLSMYVDLFALQQVRDKYVLQARPERTVSFLSTSVVNPGGFFTTTNFTDWTKSPILDRTEIELGSYGKAVPSYRSPYDVCMYQDVAADGSVYLYYTLDGENFNTTFVPPLLNYERPTTLSSVTDEKTWILISKGGFYYLLLVEIKGDPWITRRLVLDYCYRAPRTMLQIAINGARTDGFKLGQRIKLNGVPNTYGWIHDISDTSVTIRGAYGDWSNPTTRTISTDVGGGGLGLIVDATDNIVNKTSYLLPDELMGNNTDYYARVRYGDGSMKSSWSPWSKFTTGA